MVDILLKMKLKKQEGMTLVEVLAALVILGIVFIGLMAVFSQMTLFNAKTGDKLETMNLAKKELITLKNSPSMLENFDTSKENNYERYRKVNDNYEIEIDCYKADNTNCSVSNKMELLHKIHIKVIKQDKLISETFGYIAFN